jgi:hypothetical protein
MRHYPAFSTAMELTAKAALYSDLLSNKFIGRAPSTYLLPVNDALSKVAGELGKAPAGGLPCFSSNFCWNLELHYVVYFFCMLCFMLMSDPAWCENCLAFHPFAVHLHRHMMVTPVNIHCTMSIVLYCSSCT